MITCNDIGIINKALATGADVRIQNTPDGGCRILSDTVKVLKKTDHQYKPNPAKDLYK